MVKYVIHTHVHALQCIGAYTVLIGINGPIYYMCPCVFNARQSCMISVNLALNRPASQSSRDNAAKAVDGNKSPAYGNGGCTHTDAQEPLRWWRVDLGRMYLITKVEITNRDTSKQLLK